MAGELISHPHPEPNSGDLWKGTSELSGDFGDLLWGAYQRSVNVMVRDGSSVEKRRGMERAVDEQFAGWAHGHYSRNGSLAAYLFVDGDGVKVLSSVPASYFDGFTIDHSGFMADAFTRSNGASITNSGAIPWLEGQDSVQNSAYTENDTFKIASNALRLDRNDGNGGHGSADWEIAAPTPFYSIRAEIDFTSFLKTDGTSYAEVYLCLGLPDAVEDQGSGAVSHARIYTADAWRTMGQAATTAWSGVAAKIRIYVSDNANNRYRTQIQLTEFGSTVPQSDTGTRLGGVGASASVDSNERSAVNTLTSYLVEFGRMRVGDGWVTRCDLWQSKTITELEDGDQGDKFLTLALPLAIVDGAAANNKFFNLPHDGKGGFSGIRAFQNTTNLSSILDISRVSSAISFGSRVGE